MTRNRTLRPHLRRTGLAASAVLILAAPAAVAATTVFDQPQNDETFHVLSGAANPMLADGVAIGQGVPVYKSSGLGPAGLNASAPAGSELRYIDTTLFPGGLLPTGVTITEAQGLNVLERIGDNLEKVGLGYDDVVTMRVYLDNPAGASKADYAGWNRAYRQYFANVNLHTGAVIDQPTGSGALAPPRVVNAVRPSRAALEVSSFAVEGWLVEVEVDAVFSKDKDRLQKW